MHDAWTVDEFEYQSNGRAVLSRRAGERFWDIAAFEPVAKRLDSLAARIADLEAVIEKRGEGTPNAEIIDREAFDALDPVGKWMNYQEAAGWALVAREWEIAWTEAREVVAALVLACDHNEGNYNKALAAARALVKEDR